MSSLIFLLPKTSVGAATEFAYVLTPDGHSAGEHGTAPLALLPRPSGPGGEVVAIAPFPALSWHQVELPKGVTAASPRVRAVLEGLLEDRLLDEPETLHFALQPNARAGAPVWVAACDRQWLREAVQALEAAGRPISRIVPEFAPADPLALHVVGESENATLVLSGNDGVLALPLSAATLGMLPALPEDTPCLAEPAVAAQAEQLLQHAVQLEQAPQRWLRAMQSGWDLAQSEFASSNRARAAKRLAALWGDILRTPQWRPARWGAVLLVAANLVGLNAWAWKERSSLAAKREAVQRVLTTTFPQVKVVVDAPLQMEKEVALLRQTAGATSSRDLEAMLGELATVATTQQPLASIDYSGGELRAKGLVSNAQEAAAIAERLRGRGYAADLRGDTLVISVREAP